MAERLGTRAYDRLADEFVALRDRELEIERRRARRPRLIKRGLLIGAIAVPAIPVLAYIAWMAYFVLSGGICG